MEGRLHLLRERRRDLLRGIGLVDPRRDLRLPSKRVAVQLVAAADHDMLEAVIPKSGPKVRIRLLRRTRTMGCCLCFTRTSFHSGSGPLKASWSTPEEKPLL